MLQRVSSPATARQQIVRPSPGAREFISHQDIAGFLRHNFWPLVVSLSVGTLGAVVYIMLAEPLFTARTQLLIDPKLPLWLREQPSVVNISLDTAQVESQVAVLRSERIATLVIDKLKLTEDPEFQEESKPLIGMGLFVRGENVPAPSDFEQTRRAMWALQSKLDVRRAGLSYAIDISFSARTPDKAALIANELAEAYVRDQLESKAEAARQGSQWLEGRINELRRQMNVATQNVQRFKLKHDFRVVNQPSTAFDPKSLGGTGDEGEAYTLEELETTAEAYRKIYETYFQAFTASVQRQSYPVADARVITPATQPSTKSHPRPRLVLALGILVGAFSGFGISLVRHSLDGSVRSSRQVRDSLGVECLGELPRLGHGRIGTLLGIAPNGRGEGHFDEIARAPLSPFASHLQNVKTSIRMACGDRPIRCLGITSALPKEGKSTLVSNLATLFSMSGSRILVIDADLYHSILSKRFAPESTGGLVEALRKPTQTKRQIVSPKNTRFDILPVVSEPLLNSSDLLASEAMQMVLATLDQTYDLILVDLPPLKSVVDGLAISTLLDGVVLVVEWGKTPLELLADTVRSLQMAQASVLGIVITKVDNGATRTRYPEKHC
jgi:capsular exopolysaccharide synthesis family protein